MSYKLFSTGEVLTAANVNNYLMKQTVMVFADSSARTTALSGVLAAGMVSYLTGTNSLETYTGSVWTANGTGDVTLTGTQTLTNKTLTTPKITYGINAQTGTAYTLVAADQDTIVTLTNGSPITLTVPSGVYSAGQEIHLAQYGAGQVTVTGSGTTVYSTPGLKLRTQYSVASLICTASNVFILVGDLSA